MCKESDYTKIYDELNSQGIDTLLDDRDERPGFKFKDWELIGIPYMIIVGKILKELGGYNEETVNAALSKVISAKRADMLEINKKAMSIGADN